ncbi:hypothetical protein OIU77_025888 [Salix suchowensis]|uniref:ATP synthase F0 subunit 8 n=1 Tax=Salix suchowensis TaxID=1278906 RepID=A0ABQ9C149_9ROSI|nr:hypothetical protein OIU77_025888 [Salix suchowensis]KAJ6392013.1 hypothetical protein OIU77_025888 [Salix suchowensis]
MLLSSVRSLSDLQSMQMILVFVFILNVFFCYYNHGCVLFIYFLKKYIIFYFKK